MPVAECPSCKTAIAAPQGAVPQFCAKCGHPMDSSTTMQLQSNEPAGNVVPGQLDQLADVAHRTRGTRAVRRTNMAVAAQRRRARITQAIVGLVVLVVLGAGALVWHMSTDDSGKGAQTADRQSIGDRDPEQATSQVGRHHEPNPGQGATGVSSAPPTARPNAPAKTPDSTNTNSGGNIEFFGSKPQ